MKVIFLFLLTFSAWAGPDLDQRLQGYIQKFQLKTLTRPTPRGEALFKLGQSLFTDKILSGNNNIACVDCHHPKAATSDLLPLGLGEGSKGIQTATSRRSQGQGKILARNTPAVFNLADVNVMFWDGRVSMDPVTKTFKTPVPLRPEVAQTLTSALAAQALFPMVNHEEMRGQAGSNPIASAVSEEEAWSLLVEKVMQQTYYKDTFAKLFPGEKINIGHVGEAIAEFERQAFFYADTAYDRYLQGDSKAMTEIQKIGMDVFFGKGKCGECHSGEQLSNFEFHNIATPQIGPGKGGGDDFGREEWDSRSGNKYAFRVPPLRNVALTAPYMHDGAFKTLPQVIEHYDTVAEDLASYKLVNNWKNYGEIIADHDHRNDDLRLASLSPKLTRHLGFAEEEEKALSEFLTSALTDQTFINQELDGNYRTYLRMQLKESGYEKIKTTFPGESERQTYYYFDLFREGGFALRELASPIRLILVKTPSGVELVYREQAYKTAVASEGVIVDGNFNRDEKKKIELSDFANLENAYLDMFNRLYTYHDGTRNDSVPVTELSIIKSDLEVMNRKFHTLSFEGAENISDKMNTPKEDLFYVPTSFNTKDVTLFTLDIGGRIVEASLQRSFIRNERGGIETTYAVELETGKVSKAEFPEFVKKVLSLLGNLKATDVGGGSPSPSNLTLEVLKQVL